jgi:hypothetical protein
MTATRTPDTLFTDLDDYETRLKKLESAISAGSGLMRWTALPAARVATTGNIAITANAPATIDGISPAVGDLVLVWQQTNPVENGLYVWNGTTAPMTRAFVAGLGTTLPAGSRCYVISGTLFGQRDFFIKATALVGTDSVLISPPKGTVIQEAATPVPQASTQTLAVATKTIVTLNTAGTPATISYTPPVDVWWSVWTSVYVQNLQASSYAYSGSQLNVADADGVREEVCIASVVTTGTSYQTIHSFKKYKLVAGTAYTASAMIWIANGTATVYRGGGDATFNNYGQHVKTEAKVR